MTRATLAKARELKPSNYEFSAGTLIEGFEDIGDWFDPATGGTFVADTENYHSGSQSLLLGSSDTTVRKRYIYYSGGVDWSEGDFFDMWINIPVLAGGGSNVTIFFGFTTDAQGNLGGATSVTVGGVSTGTFRAGLQHIRFKKSDVSGSTNWATIYNMQLNFNPAAGAQQIGFDSLYLGKRARPKVIFTLDDGSLSQHTAYTTYFNPKGIQVSIFVNGSTIDTTGTTSAQLLAMEANGSEVCNHTYNHVDLTSLSTQAEMELEISTNTSWMKSKGLNNYNLFAYANGNFNDTAIAAVKAQGMKFARSLRGATGGITSWDMENSTLGVANKYAMNSINLNSSLSIAQAIAAVDKAKQYGSTLIFYAHKFEAAASGDTWANADIDTLTDYIVDSVNSGEIDNPVLGQWFSGIS